MTALKKYSRLECPGLWRPAPDAQRREVVVSFGKASLVLSDGRTDAALSHWSLPAVERLNPGEIPAIYAPTPDADETLELDEPAMIEAIDMVRGALVARRPRPGRLRAGAFGAVLAAVAGLGLFWLPGAVVSHTSSVVPQAKRAEIGRFALADVTRIAGAACAEPLGLRALGRLRDRLFGPGGAEIVVLRQELREGLNGAGHLPGRVVVLDRRLLEAHDTPEVAAGYALAERLRAEAADPLVPVLRAAGLGATFRLLTTGSLPATAVAGYGEQWLRRTPATVPAAALLERFAVTGLSSAPYARALAASAPEGQAARIAPYVQALLEGDPHPAASARSVLPDADWISLQAICAP